MDALANPRRGRHWSGSSASPPPPRYLVIDLSGGPVAEKYPWRFTETPPDLSCDRCRTEELWLRRIPAGTFLMGSPEDEPDRPKSGETRHIVTLTRDYYIGVFEMTQCQWRLVMGAFPSISPSNTHS